MPCFLIALAASAILPAAADIYEWEDINPLHPSPAKKESTILTPDGAGRVSAPGADLSNLNLAKGYFSEANLESADFRNTNLNAGYFWEANLSNALLLSADLSNASFNQANLQSADLSSAILTGAFFGVSDLTNADLSDSNAQSAHFSGANMTGTNLSRADLRGSRSFSNVDLSTTTFDDALIQNADFSNSIDFTKEQFFSTASWKAKDITGITLPHMDVGDWDFSGQTIRGLQLRDVSGFTPQQLYSTASWQNRDLTGLYLTGDFSHANLAHQKLVDASFGAVLSGIDLSHADLTGSVFFYPDLREADLSEANLTGVRFYVADLSGADLSGANLTRAATGGGTPINLTNANLAGANLTGSGLPTADVAGANFSGARITGALLSNTWTKEQLYSTASWQDRDLTGVRFSADLTGWDFTGQIIRQGHFGSISYGGSTKVTNFTKEQLYSTASWQNGDLMGIWFNGMDLTDWNLANQNLTAGYFLSANFSQTVLNEADARGAMWMDYTASTERRNFIAPDGQVQGVHLGSGEFLRIWNYEGYEQGTGTFFDGEFPILVKSSFVIQLGGELRLIFDRGDWGSILVMDADIFVSLDGTLVLTLADDSSPAQIGGYGTRFRIFDWDDASSVQGAFDNIVLHGDYGEYWWDTSELYSTGEIVLVPEPSSIELFGVFGGILLAIWLLQRRGKVSGI